MIANKAELILAAQKFAAENHTNTDSHAVGKLRHDAFDALGIPGQHYDDFRQRCENGANELRQAAQIVFNPETK